jgi:hypothetical protein
VHEHLHLNLATEAMHKGKEGVSGKAGNFQGDDALPGPRHVSEWPARRSRDSENLIQVKMN